ncbi:MAG: hypothetical protein M3020_09065 [Myxococcota bacterium]|nr:hypothetical protein [Myxococcota bacterium]
MSAASPRDEGSSDHATAEIIDFGAIRDWLVFAVSAIRQRKRLLLLVSVGIVALATVVTTAIPKTYRVNCRLLAQRNTVLQLRGDTGSGESAPTRAAADLVLRRENLLNLVKQTDLVRAWRENRNWLLRIKDRVTSLAAPPQTEKQMVDAMADTLASKMQVWTDETSVTIQVDWRDPLIAYRLVDAARRNFLEAKHVQEVSSVAESASILEGHAATTRTQIDEAVEEIQALRERKKNEKKEEDAAPPPKPSAAPVAARPAAPPPPKLNPEQEALKEQQARRLSELPVVIESKERSINELEGFRLRRQAELQARLQETKAQYTDEHPTVLDAKQALQAASQESPQVTKLRADLKQLRGEYESLRAATGDTSKPRIGAGRYPGVTESRGLGDVIRIEQESAEERDPEVEYARAKLRFAISNYQGMQEQIHRARIDLDTAQAAFKYRYTTVTPPEVPKGPIAPKVPLIIVAALIGGLVIGSIAAVALELHEGIISASWQIKRATSLPVLATMRTPELPRHSP